MAENKKSKTDVSARTDSKNSAKICRFCGNKVEVVLAVSSGKKKMKRVCCDS